MMEYTATMRGHQVYLISQLVFPKIVHDFTTEGMAEATLEEMGKASCGPLLLIHTLLWPISSTRERVDLDLSHHTFIFRKGVDKEVEEAFWKKVLRTQKVGRATGVPLVPILSRWSLAQADRERRTGFYVELDGGG